MFAKAPEEAIELLRCEDPLSEFIDRLATDLRGQTLTSPSQIQSALSLLGLRAWPGVADALGLADDDVRFARAEAPGGLTGQGEESRVPALSPGPHAWAPDSPRAVPAR